MKQIINYKYTLLIFLFATVSSCEKYIDRNPLSSNSQADFYNDGNQVQQALVGVYSAVGARTISPGFGNPTTYYAKLDLYTELGMERGLSNTIGSGTYSVNDGSCAELWAGFFQVIQRANNLMFYMVKAKGVMTPADYNRVIAEAKVLRAMAYWHLIGLFGDVPFFKGPPASQDEIYSFVRTDKKVIINFLISDLEAAANDLDWNPAQPGRVSKGVAKGIAARLAMLDKNYIQAASITDDIITNGGYGLNPVFENLFRKGGQATNANKEIMFYYPYGDADAGSFTYLQLVQGSRNNGGQSSHFPSQFLVDLFESRDGKTIDQSPLYDPSKPNQSRDPRMSATVFVPGDTMVVQGFTSIIFNFANQFVTAYNPNTKAITFQTTTANQDSANIFGPRLNGLGNLWKKYSNDRDINGNAGNSYKVGWVFMRLGEILLINAEAHLEKGDASSVVATSINRVRARAGMPNVDASTLSDIKKLRQLVRREKCVELANEGLHLADMRRWDDGAYAAKVMPLQLYGESKSSMKFTTGIGLQFVAPAPVPLFDATYNVPISWPNGDALRLKREQRVFNVPQHLLCPIPQGERDKVNSLTQNPGW